MQCSAMQSNGREWNVMQCAMQCHVCRAKERCGVRKFGSPCTMDSAWDLDPIWWMVSKLLVQSIKQWDHYYYSSYYTYIIHYYYDILWYHNHYIINHDGSQTYLGAFLKWPNSRTNRLDLSPGKGEVCSRPLMDGRGNGWQLRKGKEPISGSVNGDFL